jgi:hypothetical protein
MTSVWEVTVRTSIITEDFRSFPQSFQKHTTVVSFHIHISLQSRHSKLQSGILTASLNRLNEHVVQVFKTKETILCGVIFGLAIPASQRIICHA